MHRILSIVFVLVFVISCGDETTGPEKQVDITKDEAATAVQDVLAERGLFPSAGSSANLSAASQQTAGIPSSVGYMDYVDVDIDGDGRIDVTFDIGPDGNIIPQGDWRDENPDFCREKIRFMKGAQKNLNFKIFPFSDGWSVFVQYIDVPTTKVENQREGQAPSPNLDGLKNALDNALSDFEPDIKSAKGPCGEKFPLELVLTSTTEIEGVYSPQTGTNSNIVVQDQVNAEVPLTYNSNQQAYEGSGELSWQEYQVQFPESPNTTADCQLPATKNANVPRFYDGVVDSVNQGNKTAYIQPEQWGLPLATCTITFPDGSTITQNNFFKAFPTTWSVLQPPVGTNITKNGQSIAVFEIKDWQEVPDNDDIIARRTYDRSETADTLGFKNYTEETTIEIRRRE